MKRWLPRVRPLSSLSVQEKIRPQQGFCPSEESCPSTARSLFVKVCVPRLGISRMTPHAIGAEVRCFQKLRCAMHSRSANVWILCSEMDAPRAQQTCSPLPRGPSSACTASVGLALGFLGETCTSAVNTSGSHSVRLATSGQMLRDDVGPTAHNTALGSPVPSRTDIPIGSSTHPAQVLCAAEACWTREAGGSWLIHWLWAGFSTTSQLDRVCLHKLNPHT